MPRRLDVPVSPWALWLHDDLPDVEGGRLRVPEHLRDLLRVPVGEWLMVAVNWYRPTVGPGGWQLKASTGDLMRSRPG
jgi:hypothetical protein